MFIAVSKEEKMLKKLKKIRKLSMHNSATTFKCVCEYLCPLELFILYPNIKFYVLTFVYI